MDLILGPFADARLATLDLETLGTYEALLGENDQDLYQWVSGQAQPPKEFTEMIDILRDHSRNRFAQTSDQ